MCVSYYMSVIAQDGWSALMEATMWGKTEVVVQLAKAGASMDMENDVCKFLHYIHVQNHAQYWSQPFFCQI